MSNDARKRVFAAVSVAVSVLFATQAARANDLEERIAELEATTADKGTRKVSLTISGWVNEAVTFWDDGTESNAYVGTNEFEQNRFRLVGEAKAMEGWSAGYIIEVGVNGAGSKSFSQTNTGTSAITARKSAWFLKSKTYGKFSVGKTDTATYHLLDNIDTSLTRFVSDYEAAGAFASSFIARSNGVLLGTTKWTDLMTGFNVASAGQDGLRNVVSYESPEIAGFTFAAAWGSDDQADVALRYKGEAAGFKYQAALGYGESTDPAVNAGNCTKGGTGDCQWLGTGLFISHIETGLFLYGGYGVNWIELSPANAAKDDSSETAYIQGGIERKWLPLGRTNLFVEYRKDDTGFIGAIGNGAELDMWATGVVQHVEAAETTLYAVYRHYDGEITRTTGARTDLDSLDMIVTGAKINF